MVAAEIGIARCAKIPTWFGVGGGADAFLTLTNADELGRLIATYPDLKIVGDGANLLVDDEGVGELVVSLAGDAAWSIDAKHGLVTAAAGTNLPKLINACVREGLAGLEVLAGIPASVGGALVMNAGGGFGQIADVVERVHGFDRAGSPVTITRNEIDFAYRHSGLEPLLLTRAELRLTPGDQKAIRARQVEIMAYKSESQPMAANSAGCVWKNPTLAADMRDIGAAGTRVSAGMLIDRAGLKGLGVGGASISPRHANFVVTQGHACARHVIDLMRETRARVFDAFGVRLEPEVVIWRRGGVGLDADSTPGRSG